MNKIKFFLLAAVAIIAVSYNAQAQKTGYIRVDDVVRLMPETQKIQGALEKFQSDSLQPRLQYTLSEYQRKDSLVNGKDSLKTPAAVRAQIREELQQMMYELNNWQQIQQQVIQQKQDQLLEPIYTKAINAIQQVAKDNGYAYVYVKDALLVAPPADDLLPLVAKRLNLTVPNAGAPAKPAAGATNNTGAKKQ
jgi:outer membrane protein